MDLIKLALNLIDGTMSEAQLNCFFNQYPTSIQKSVLRATEYVKKLMSGNLSDSEREELDKFEPTETSLVSSLIKELKSRKRGCRVEFDSLRELNDFIRLERLNKTH